MGNAAQGLWNVEWLNQNAQRRYPLHDDVTAKDVTGTFTLPNDFLVDLIWPVHADPSIDPTLFHVLSVGVFGTGVTLSLGYNGSPIGSATIDAATFSTNQTFLIHGTGVFFDTVGKVVLGSLETILNHAGLFIFDTVGARLSPTVVKPDIRGVSALYVQNGDELSAAIQDDVIIQAGTRMLINLVQVPGEPTARLVFNAIDGLNLNESCACNTNSTAPCIKTINGISPDDGGNFTLNEDECLKLDSIANGLQLHDDCAKPCCGCDELKVIQQTLEFVVQQVTSLENLAYRLETAVQTTQVNLLNRR